MASSLTKTSQLKEINIEKVRLQLRQEVQVTKAEMVKLSGLSLATCGNILRAMVATGEILEVTLADSTGGRPAKNYKLNKHFHHTASIYARKLQSTLVLVCRVYDLTGTIVKEHEATHPIFDPIQLYDFMDQVLAADPQIHVIALGLPGVIRHGQVLVCDIPSLANLDLGKVLKERYTLPVVIENDVNSTVLGFYQRVQTVKSESTVYIYYPQSDVLGSGIIINGKILYGKSNFAGEAGFLPLNNYSGTSVHAMTANDFAKEAAKMLMAFICIINPDNIVVSGYRINGQTLLDIQEELDLICDKAHQPNLHWELDIKDNYLWGLRALALDRLSPYLMASNNN